jgi:hypothetical protein
MSSQRLLALLFPCFLLRAGEVRTLLATATIILTLRCIVYASGSGEKGQLGVGRTGEHIATGNKTAFDVEPEPSEHLHL